MRCSRARDFDGSQISVTTGEFEPSQLEDLIHHS